MNLATPIPIRGEAGLVGQRITLGIRPEHIHLRRSGADELGLTATIELLEQLGATSFLYCALPSGEKLTVQVAGQIDKHPGEEVVVCFPASRVHLFGQTEAEPAFERLSQRAADRAA